MKSGRRTIAREAEIEGIGLHLGKPCRLVFRPAAAGSGIAFIRTDRGGKRVQATADTAVLVPRFDAAERACRGLIEGGLTLPAYEQVLEASHTFNLLDARRAISVSERQRYILRVREMARSVAQAYHDSRAALGFPMLARVPATST